MKNKIIICIIQLLLVAAYIGVKAVPACPYPIRMAQSDGTSITVLLHGDEFFAYFARKSVYKVHIKKCNSAKINTMRSRQYSNESTNTLRSNCKKCNRNQKGIVYFNWFPGQTFR